MCVYKKKNLALAMLTLCESTEKKEIVIGKKTKMEPCGAIATMHGESCLQKVPAPLFGESLPWGHKKCVIRQRIYGAVQLVPAARR